VPSGQSAAAAAYDPLKDTQPIFTPRTPTLCLGLGLVARCCRAGGRGDRVCVLGWPGGGSADAGGCLWDAGGARPPELGSINLTVNCESLSFAYGSSSSTRGRHSPGGRGGLSPATRSLMMAGRPRGGASPESPVGPRLWLPSSPPLGEFRLSLPHGADHRSRQRR
jgi:hypothetical protein